MAWCWPPGRKRSHLKQYEYYMFKTGSDKIPLEKPMQKKIPRDRKRDRKRSRCKNQYKKKIPRDRKRSRCKSPYKKNIPPTASLAQWWQEPPNLTKLVFPNSSYQASANGVYPGCRQACSGSLVADFGCNIQLRGGSNARFERRRD